MTIIFLDIDGVLNVMGVTYRSMICKSRSIETHLMERLEFILDRSSNTRVVISSAWGILDAIDKLTKMRFKHLDKIIGRTDRHMRYRGNQIQHWLDTHKDLNVTNYVVLEDEINDVCGSKCSTIPKEHVIEVNMVEGLSETNTLDTVRLLQNISYDSDDEPIEFTRKNYNEHYARGYRSNVLLSEPLEAGDLDRWQQYILDSDKLMMIMSKL